MKKLLIATLILTIFTSSAPLKGEKNTNPEAEWQTLFDGETLNGWHRFNRKGVQPIWKAENGFLIFDPTLRP